MISKEQLIRDIQMNDIEVHEWLLYVSDRIIEDRNDYHTNSIVSKLNA